MQINRLAYITIVVFGFWGLTACGGGGGGNRDSSLDGDALSSFAVTPATGANGSISPATSQIINQGETTSFIITPDTGHNISSVDGTCGGTLNGNTYTTYAIITDCTVVANFGPITHTVTLTAGANGSISPATPQTINLDETTSFTITPEFGYSINGVAGTCGGTLSGSTYTTATITADCEVEASFSPLTMILTPQSIKTFTFSWTDVNGETEYRLLENADGISGYSQVASIAADTTNYNHEVFLPARVSASYILQACNNIGCIDSATVFVSDTLRTAIGYVKASNTGENDRFGGSVAISSDGSTLAVGAYREDSNATGVGGNQTSHAASNSGAVYVFSRNGGAWSQQAYLKASNTGANDEFGVSVALSGDGNTLAVGAYRESSDATGVNGDQINNSAISSGSVYVFTRTDVSWSQQAYLKASNTEAIDQFGISIALASDGNTLAVGAHLEDSSAIGVGGDQANGTTDSGAVYVFSRTGGNWSQEAYLKASNTGANDWFGRNVAIAGNGNTLAVGARLEDSSATGVDGDQANNEASNSGAVYVFNRSGGAWSQQAYLKASNTGEEDLFGLSVALDADGNTLAVGANREDSNATGVNNDQTNNGANNSGAVYVFSRSDATWSQQAYLKASNTEEFDGFGSSVALSGDGNTLAVGAHFESSSATGLNGNQASNSAVISGAVYIFIRSGVDWSQQAYVKASNTGREDRFGENIALASDGSTLAVGATSESSNATGVGGNQNNNEISGSGAVYLY